MPSASNTIKLEKSPNLSTTLAENSATTTAGTASIISNDNNANNPMKLVLVTIEHKIRNLEKRKTKLESYRLIQASGKELSSDQKAAVAKFDAVAQTLEFARDLSKQITQFAKDAEKEQKKQARKENILKAQAETAKIREVLIIQNILSCLTDDYIRMDFLNGENGAVKIDAADLNIVEKFCSDIQARRPENVGDVPFSTAAQKAAEYLSMTIDGRPKQYGSSEVTFETVRRIFNQIQECGYLDKVYLAAQEENADAVVEQRDETAVENDVDTTAVASSVTEFANEKKTINAQPDEMKSCENQLEKVVLEDGNATGTVADGQKILIKGQESSNEQSDIQQQQQVVNSLPTVPGTVAVAAQPPQPQRQRISSATAFASGTASPVQVTAMFMPPTAQPSGGVINQQTQSQQQMQQALQQQPQPSIQPQPQQQQQQQMPAIQPNASGNAATLVTSAQVQTLHSGGAAHFPATTVRAVEQGYFKQHQYMQQIRPLAEVIGGGSFYFLQDSELDSPDVMMQQQQMYETAGQQQQNLNHEHQKQQEQISHAPPQQPQVTPLPHQMLQQQQQQQQPLPTQPQQQQQGGKIATVATNTPIPTQTFTNQSFPPTMQVPTAAAAGPVIYNQHQTGQPQQQPPQVIDKQPLFPTPGGQQDAIAVNNATDPQQAQPQQQQQQPLIIMARVPPGRIPVNAAGTPTVLPIQGAVAAGFQFENQVVPSIPHYEQQQQHVGGIPTQTTITGNHTQPHQPAINSLNVEKSDDSLTTTAVQPSVNDWDTNKRNGGENSMSVAGGREVDATATQTIETNQWSTEMNSISPPPQQMNENANNNTTAGGKQRNGTFDNNRHQSGHESNHWNSASNQGGGDGNNMGGSGYGTGGRGRWRNYRNDRNRDNGAGGGGGGRNDRGDRGMRGSGASGAGGDRGGRSNFSSQQNGGGRNSGSVGGGYFRNNENSFYQNGGGNAGGTGGYNSSKEGGGGGNRYENSAGGGGYRSRGGNNSSRPSNNQNNNSSNRPSIGGAGGGSNVTRGGRNSGNSSSYINSRQSSRQQDVA